MNRTYLGVVQQLERCARDQGRMPAVVDGHSFITWSELERFSTLVAETLATDIGPKFVAIEDGRNCPLVVSVVGCIKARRPFFLVDDALPATRRTWLMEECQPAIHWSSRAIVEGLPGRPTSSPRKDGTILSGQTPPSRELYRVFTSGSTGRPKAVAISAENVDKMVPSLLDAVPTLWESRRIGLTASLGFDVALQQIFLSLAIGSTLVIPSDLERRSPDLLLEFWRRHKVDVADGTPTLLRMLGMLPERLGEVPSLKTLLIGGEVLKKIDVAAFRRRFGSRVSIYNLYGLAECAIDSAVGFVDGNIESPDRILPVGMPLAHAKILILDPSDREVPAGETGEIVVGGQGVGLGYPNLPEETRRRFRPLTLEGGPWYWTGDRGWVDTRGRLWVAGRQDREVKIAGRRLDLTEVESLVQEYASTELRQLTSLAALYSPEHVKRCRTCVLSDGYPAANLDDNGECAYCVTMTDASLDGWGYFQGAVELAKRLETARSEGQTDVVVLFSGGKDSSYVLHQLLERGVRVAAFTFDNGYISKQALANIDRVVAKFGIPHQIGRPVDDVGLLASALKLDATVCSGCYWGITRLGCEYAAQIGASLVFTGLSRGQLIETKLSQFVKSGPRDLRNIDLDLQRYGHLYLHRENSFARSVLGSMPVASSVEAIEIVDYFRYDSASKNELMRYLGIRDPQWRKPSDTGVCSSNCRANDAGIAIHALERGFHNYEGPLSWDVRLGLVSREEALSQLEGGVDGNSIRLVLGDLERRAECAVVKGETGGLVGFVTGFNKIDLEGLNHWLSERAPSYMLLSSLHEIEALPRQQSGKVDYGVLEDRAAALATGERLIGGENRLHDSLASDWATVLGKPPARLAEDFFRAGGDSLSATALAVRLEERFARTVPLSLVFENPTFMALAKAVEVLLSSEEAGMGSRRVLLPRGLRAVTMRHVGDDLARKPSSRGLVVAMPSLTGRGLPLRPVLGGVDSLDGFQVMGVVVEDGDGLDIQGNWVERLIEGVSQSLAFYEKLPETVIFTGWSFGAVVAHIAAKRLEAELTEAGRSTRVVELLVDPMPALSDDILQMREYLAGGLESHFPHLPTELPGEDAWAGVLRRVARVLQYSDGASRLSGLLPAELRGLLTPSSEDDRGRAGDILNAVSALEWSDRQTPLKDGLRARWAVPTDPQTLVLSAANFAMWVERLAAECGDEWRQVSAGDAHNGIIDARWAPIYEALLQGILEGGVL
jgi:acyl-coenzyme A synthetase/AMP-(fatty) acid ligase/acyl carrier protein